MSIFMEVIISVITRKKVHMNTRLIVNGYRDQGRRLGVASGATAPGPALEGAPRFRPMSLSSYILR